MPAQSPFWKLMAVLFVAGLFYLGNALHSRSLEEPAIASPLFAGGVGVATDQAETIFTASEDGKTVYMWQYYGSKPPKYKGKAEAVLSK